MERTCGPRGSFYEQAMRVSRETRLVHIPAIHSRLVPASEDELGQGFYYWDMKCETCGYIWHSQSWQELVVAYLRHVGIDATREAVEEVCAGRGRDRSVPAWFYPARTSGSS